MWESHMEYKNRTKPIELEVLEILNRRMDLSEKDQQHYFNLKKGYEGEIAFDELTRNLQCDCLVLNDLLLQVGSTVFQIDTIIIADKLYLYEVKNYEGDYYYDKERIYNKANYEITNPINQLTRAESLLRQLLHPLGITTEINSSIVFINPEFTLYQAPLDKAFILPTQVNRYFKQFNSRRSRISTKHRALADKLISMHLPISPYSQLPAFTYEELRKGVVCQGCGSFRVFVEGKFCVCEICGAKELVEKTVLRCVKEFKKLFANERITTKVIHDWCQIFTKKRVSRILEKFYNKVGKTRWMYFN
jgi:hypothetical protein